MLQSSCANDLQFHVNEDPGFTTKGRDLCRHRCEIEAYKLLLAAGICEQGFVPKFYALFEGIDPLSFTPYLNAFLCDLHHPCAILLEYLTNLDKLLSRQNPEGHFGYPSCAPCVCSA